MFVFSLVWARGRCEGGARGRALPLERLEEARGELILIVRARAGGRPTLRTDGGKAAAGRWVCGPRPLGDSEVRSHSQMGPVRRAASWWWWWWLVRDGRMSQCERLLRLTHGHQCAGSRGLARSRAGQWRLGGETCEGGKRAWSRSAGTRRGGRRQRWRPAGGGNMRA